MIMQEYLDTNFDINSNELVEVFDELPLWAAAFGLKLLDKLRLRKNITILDIGFGAGFPLTELAMRYGETCIIYGIDPWKAAIKRALKKIEFYGIKNIKIIDGVAEDVPLDNSSVDLIVSNNGLNNVDDLDKALSECSRIIKNDGQFILTFNLNTTMIEFYNILGDLLLELNLNSELQKMKQHIYKKRRPFNEFIEKLERNGFVIKEIDQSKFEYKFVDGTAMLNHYFIRLAFLDAWKNIIPSGKRTEIFNELEYRMNKIAGSNGLFNLTVPFVVIDSEKKN